MRYRKVSSFFDVSLRHNNLIYLTCDKHEITTINSTRYSDGFIRTSIAELRSVNFSNLIDKKN